MDAIRHSECSIETPMSIQSRQIAAYLAALAEPKAIANIQTNRRNGQTGRIGAAQPTATVALAIKDSV